MCVVVQILFSLVSNSLSYITIPKTKEKKIWTKDKIEPQHNETTMFYLWIDSLNVLLFVQPSQTGWRLMWEAEYSLQLGN